MKKIRILPLLMALLISVSVFAACSSSSSDGINESSNAGNVGGAETEAPAERYINGVSLEDYTIVYSPDDHDYSWRAAEYIQKQIELVTTLKLDVRYEVEGSFEHEIVVGETSRDISKALDADTEGFQFAILADDAHIAMEGDYFIIAAAAYFFVDTYVSEDSFDTQVPKEVSIHDPIVKEAENFILLIGDGMGVNQTKLFDVYDVDVTSNKNYSDGEDFFYGYLFPYAGTSITTSLSGVTDSAAGGTALATGYKTFNSRVGKDKEYNDIQSITELAGSLGMSTAVMSTDDATGATPASFSAHANSRSDSEVISASQDALEDKYGTIIDCGHNKYDVLSVLSLQYRIDKNLDKLSQNENGFFMMYEEAHIDKHSHNDNMDDTFNAVVRFNQAIALFMEFAFYNPDTFVLITADHETGGLKISDDGTFSYTSGGTHTGAAVPVFAYGMGAEMFNGATVENVEIPKQIAKLLGVDEFGGPLHSYDYFW